MSMKSNQKLPVFLIVGSDTGVGKTVFTGLFGWYVNSKNIRLRLFKPFCSGEYRDIDFLKKANSDFHNAEINYWYGDEPISPAAWELSNRNQINFKDIVKKMRKESKSDDFDVFLVEGVGGLLAPITQKYSVASLGQELGSNLIIIARNQVGVINHVLLTAEAALSRGLSVASVILMEQEEPDASTVDNAELIRMHIPNMRGFRGVFEFPWLGREASNPDLIPINVKKADSILEKIFNEVFKPYFINILRN